MMFIVFVRRTLLAAIGSLTFFLFSVVRAFLAGARGLSLFIFVRGGGVTTFILVVGGGCFDVVYYGCGCGLFVGDGEFLSGFTESLVDFSGVPFVGGHDEHEDTNGDEKDGADELGPEGGDHEGDT